MKIQSHVCTKINPWEPGDDWPILHPDSEFYMDAGEKTTLWICPHCRLGFHTVKPKTCQDEFIKMEND